MPGEGRGKARHLGADIRPDESLDPNATDHHLGRTPSLWALCEDSMDARPGPRRASNKATLRVRVTWPGVLSGAAGKARSLCYPLTPGVKLAGRYCKYC